MEDLQDLIDSVEEEDVSTDEKSLKEDQEHEEDKEMEFVNKTRKTTIA